ncbi:hypothetical protein NDU88_002085 [Pleurodeles waltl]|uniref:Uncharacterized protein n=1 Tax=Pleurodeles waltl TaxID=8319 RepID=A0AAV7VDK7_PLEWA|nr:hypothetical protein NDU88_002085 [Pleurodeles waltl]
MAQYVDLRLQQQRAAVTSIRLPGGSVVTSDAQIDSAFCDFYRALYSAQPADLGPSHCYVEQACPTKLMPV